MSRRSHYRSSKPSRAGQHGAAATASNGTPAPAPRPQPAQLGVPPEREPQLTGHDIADPTATGDVFQPAVPAPSGHALNGHSANGQAPGPGSGDAHASAAGCTAPQLRRFIKSRSWVPMHELRRRFAINGNEDDVTPVSVEGSTIFVGLPTREGRLLGELFQGGDIGFELSMDPCTPIVIGVYPMRPVPRH
jgi:hypothetical protein